MIKHIVFWIVKEEAEGLKKDAILSKMKTMLEALPSHIEVVKGLEVGLNVIASDRAFDIALYSSFDSLEDLKTYANHPEHLKVVDFFKKVVEKSAAVDYKV